MNLNEFLEYLRSRSATSDLAESLAQVLVRRGRLDLVPIPVRESARRRIAG
jgi:hypothetical protein